MVVTEGYTEVNDLLTSELSFFNEVSMGRTGRSITCRTFKLMVLRLT